MLATTDLRTRLDDVRGASPRASARSRTTRAPPWSPLAVVREFDAKADKAWRHADEATRDAVIELEQAADSARAAADADPGTSAGRPRPASRTPTSRSASSRPRSEQPALRGRAWPPRSPARGASRAARPRRCGPCRGSATKVSRSACSIARRRRVNATDGASPISSSERPSRSHAPFGTVLRPGAQLLGDVLRGRRRRRGRRGGPGRPRRRPASPRPRRATSRCPPLSRTCRRRMSAGSVRPCSSRVPTVMTNATNSTTLRPGIPGAVSLADGDRERRGERHHAAHARPGDDERAPPGQRGSARAAPSGSSRGR